MGGGPLWAQGQRLRELVAAQFSEATLILREPPALGPTRSLTELWCHRGKTPKSPACSTSFSQTE